MYFSSPLPSGILPLFEDEFYFSACVKLFICWVGKAAKFIQHKQIFWNLQKQGIRKGKL